MCNDRFTVRQAYGHGLHVTFQVGELADAFIICYVSISHKRLVRLHLSELIMKVFLYFMLPKVDQNIILQT